MDFLPTLALVFAVGMPGIWAVCDLILLGLRVGAGLGRFLVFVL